MKQFGVFVAILVLITGTGLLVSERPDWAMKAVAGLAGLAALRMLWELAGFVVRGRPD